LATPYLAQDYSIEKLDLTKLKESVWGPYLFNGFLYYSSDTKSKSYKSSKNKDGSNFHDIHRVQIDKYHIKSKPERLPKNINTITTDGPVSFDTKESSLYFTRSMDIEKEYSNLGIFISKLTNDTFANPVSFVYNNITYNVGHPALNEKGDLLVFASDMPGGFGKSDLYFCSLVDGKWSTPVSLGDSINTRFKESFPFLYKNQLYFSSDRDGGIGELDIYRSFYTNNGWSFPELLNAPINSVANDFSIFLTNGLQEGYMSSDRGEMKKDKILFFERIIPKPEKFIEVEPVFCYDFKDEKFTGLKDVTYEWEFGDGQKAYGNHVNHCFNRMGSYNVRLHITDNYIDFTYKNLYVDTLNITTENNRPYVVCDVFEDKYDFYVDFFSCNIKYDHFYWLIDGLIYEDEKISLPKTVKQVKYVTWQSNKPQQALGIVKKEFNR
tara:strand:- start:5772 stop:7085 length:1314 start_codon:yes stop_codon:yes gene_type:complete